MKNRTPVVDCTPLLTKRRAVGMLDSRVRFGDYHRMSEEDPILYPVESPSMVMFSSVGEQVSYRPLAEDARSCEVVGRELDQRARTITERYGWHPVRLDFQFNRFRRTDNVHIIWMSKEGRTLRSIQEINDYLQFGKEPR